MFTYPLTQLATNLTCDPYYDFFLGRYNGARAGLVREDHLDTVFYRPITKEFEGNVSRGFSLTLVFHRLVLQALCIKSPERLTFDAMPKPFLAYAFKFGEGTPC